MLLAGQAGAFGSSAVTINAGATVDLGGFTFNDNSFTVNGGTLAGTGSVFGTVQVGNNAVVAPGVGGTGTLATGSPTFTNGSSFNVDLAGNKSPASAPSVGFTLDNTAPSVTIGNPSVNYAPGGGSVSFAVTYDDTNLAAAVDKAVDLGAQYVSNSYGTGYSSTPGSGEDASEIALLDPHYNHPGVVVTASPTRCARRGPCPHELPVDRQPALVDSAAISS